MEQALCAAWPPGLRSWLLQALRSPYDSAFGFDTWSGGPLGNRYAANDYSLFRLVEHYVCITGDRAFLDEQAGPLTVLAHLKRLACGWKAKRSEATGGVLADFGADPWTLLECVPNYVNVVASFNAAYVGMTRVIGGLLQPRARGPGRGGGGRGGHAGPGRGGDGAAVRALADPASRRYRVDRALPGLRSGGGAPARRPELGAAGRGGRVRVREAAGVHLDAGAGTRRPGCPVF